MRETAKYSPAIFDGLKDQTRKSDTANNGPGYNVPYLAQILVRSGTRAKTRYPAKGGIVKKKMRRSRILGQRFSTNMRAMNTTTL